VQSRRIALEFRALRVKQALRQDDLARAAKLSRSKISRLERGLIDAMTIGDVDRAARALGAVLDIRVRWHGEQLDRLLDEGHARLVELVVTLLRASGWEVAVEVSYSIWGERGSIDVFAFHRLSGIVLVVEVKSIVPDSQATLHGMDRKVRLAREIAEERGWACRHVARILVIGDSATSRRRVERLTATYNVAFPLRGVNVRRWLRAPVGSISGLLFLSYAHDARITPPTAGRLRVRRRTGRRKHPLAR
jgi:transcriptional regulator with XRE-family HTH domain